MPINDLPAASDDALEGAWTGVIAADATAHDAPVDVLIPTFSSTFKFGPCRWQPRPAPLSITAPASVTAIGAATTVTELKTALLAALELLELPKKGDACLVVFDSDGEPWVPAWWPA